MTDRRTHNLGFGHFPERRKGPRRRDLSRALGETVVAFEKERLEKHKISEELEKLERRLIEEAYTDELTGISNSRAFYEQGQELVDIAQQNDEPLALLVADSNSLHAVNRTNGYEAGNQLLISIAKKLTETARRTDLVARIGGDEFGVILTGFKPLPGVTEGELVGDIIVKYKDALKTDASIGLAVLQPGETFQSLHARADALCVADKPAGPSR